MSWNLCVCTGGTGGDVLFDESLYSWPCIFAVYKFQGPVLSKMSREGVIMLIVKNTKTEVVGVGDIDMVVQMEETVEVD